MDITEDLALLLGMLCGDGCLPIKHNGDGYLNHQIVFFNTNKAYVELFHYLFLNVFDINGKIFCRHRPNKQPLWRFEKYSKQIYTTFTDTLGVPNGKKALSVFIPEAVLNSAPAIKKQFFLGLLITDGGLRKDGSMVFHMASKRIVHDLAALIKELWGFDKPVKEYAQKSRFQSYQLNLRKIESDYIISDLPVSHNLVLR